MRSETYNALMKPPNKTNKLIPDGKNYFKLLNNTFYDFVKETSVRLTHGNFHETETKIYYIKYLESIQNSRPLRLTLEKRLHTSLRLNLFSLYRGDRGSQPMAHGESDITRQLNRQHLKMLNVRG